MAGRICRRMLLVKTFFWIAKSFTARAHGVTKRTLRRRFLKFSVHPHCCSCGADIRALRYKRAPIGGLPKQSQQNARTLDLNYVRKNLEAVRATLEFSRPRYPPDGLDHRLSKMQKQQRVRLAVY